MDSLQFRSYITTKLRAFESWAWKDFRANPEDWEEMDLAAWRSMFNDYLDGEAE